MVYCVQHGGVYQLRNIDGETHDRMINEKYLKRYFPIIQEMKKTVN